MLLIRILWGIYGQVPLNSEEAQYWLWSKHLALSYYSKPPLVALVNSVSAALLGNTGIGIRINAILIGFILPLVHYVFAANLFHDEKVTFWSVMVLFTLPHYHFISMFFTTDTLVLLFWSLCILFSWNALRKNSISQWILAGCMLGLGIMSKYTMVLWVPAFVLVGFLTDKNLLKNPRFYLALFLAVLICSPVIYWNISQGFVGVKHLLGLMGAYKTHAHVLRSAERIFEYLGGQLASLSPLFIPVFYEIYRKWRKKDLNVEYAAVSFLLVPLLLVWALFLVLSVQKNEINWTFFAFTSVPLLIGYSLVHFFDQKQRIVVIGLTAILVFLFLNPSVSDQLGLRKLYPPKTDLYHKQTGWDKLGENVTEIRQEIGTEKVFIFSDSYHISSELAFYVEGNPQTYCINNGRRMNQFDLWPGIEQFAGKGFEAIYVSSKPLPDWFHQSFQKIELVKTQKRIHRQQEVKPPFQIYRLSGFYAFREPLNQCGY